MSGIMWHAFTFFPFVIPRPTFYNYARSTNHTQMRKLEVQED